MANPPFNVDKVKAESAESAGRLPFGLPSVNKNKEISNGNYLWISYFYSYLNETGRAGFVMASSSTDSQGKDKDIREKLVRTGHVDVMISVGNNFFYTRSLPCSLWFFDKGKKEEIKDKVLFIDARNYYTVVDRTLNEWNEYQLENLSAIVALYRGDNNKYYHLVDHYEHLLHVYITHIKEKGLLYTANYLLENTRWTISQKENQSQFSSICDSLKNDIENLHWYDLIKDTQQLEHLKTLKQSVNKFENLAMLATKYNDFEGSYYHYSYDDEIEIPYPQPYHSKASKKASFTAMLKNDCLVAHRELDSIISVLEAYFWLTEKFSDGQYNDIAGLCKIATIDEIESKEFSLTPGAYVGVAPMEDDGVDFNKRMAEIHEQLQLLQAESNQLMQTISRNWEELNI